MRPYTVRSEGSGAARLPWVRPPGRRVPSRAMASSRRHGQAWILLLAALSLPGWELAHAFVHEHLAHHHGEQEHRHGARTHLHGEAAGTAHRAHDLALTPDESAHEHGHLDGIILPTTRSHDASWLVALPSGSPEAVARREATPRFFEERAPPRASPEAADPSHPRAPPHA